MAQGVLGYGPVQRDALPRLLLQGGTIGCDGLLQALRLALALPKELERISQVGLGRGPVQRDALPRPLLQRSSSVICRTGSATERRDVSETATTRMLGSRTRPLSGAEALAPCCAL